MIEMAEWHTQVSGTALANSLRVAVDATLLALTLGLVVAVLVTRRTHRPGLRRLLRLFDGVFMLPLGVSAVTVGFGLLVTLDRPPLDLRGSPWLVPVAQASDSPIKLVGVGEGLEDLQPFNARAFARSLVGLQETVA